MRLGVTSRPACMHIPMCPAPRNITRGCAKARGGRDEGLAGGGEEKAVIRYLQIGNGARDNDGHCLAAAERTDGIVFVAS